MLRASLPPLRYSTTRLRRVLPCARARSDKNAGAARPTVKAATPLWMNCRRVARMATVLHELVRAGPDDQVHEAGGLVGELRVRARPCASGTDVVEQRLIRCAVV